MFICHKKSMKSPSISIIVLIYRFSTSFGFIFKKLSLNNYCSKFICGTWKNFRDFSIFGVYRSAVEIGNRFGKNDSIRFGLAVSVR